MISGIVLKHFLVIKVKASLSTIEEPRELFSKHLKVIEIQMLIFSSYALDGQVP